MRLVQKSLSHTGYIILKDGSVVPCFTDKLIEEAKNKVPYNKTAGLYGTNTKDVPDILSTIEFYKKKYNVLPQNYVAQLRTGFNTCPRLHQSSNLFLYK